MLLAAGDGTRLGQPKATVELGGLTLAERGVRLLRGGGADPVLVVTGAVPVDVPGTLAVPNPDWESGMGSSLAAGLRALIDGTVLSPAGEELTAVVIALADQPLIGTEAVRRLLAAHRAPGGVSGRASEERGGAGAAVAVAAYGGKPRNPVLIGRAYWAAVLETAAGDTGARPFLRAHPDLVTLVECGDVGSPDDIDTPDDLARVREKLAAAR
jgi:nicotine blue oxidoreductase